MNAVLEVGSESGYQTANLSELVKEVYAIEIIPTLYELGEINLKSFEYRNLFLKKAMGESGGKLMEMKSDPVRFVPLTGR